MARQLSLFAYGVTRKSASEKEAELAADEAAEIEEAVIDKVSRITPKSKS